MYWTKRHVLICTASHCSQKGATDVAGKLRLDILRKGLDTEILVNTCGTIDLCDIGPNIVVYPDNVILSGVTTKDIPDIVAYLRGGDVPTHLVLGPTSDAESRRRSLYVSLVESGNWMSPDALRALVSEHGLADDWVSEQLKRGFLAKKPTDEGEFMVATSKARTRYGV